MEYRLLFDVELGHNTRAHKFPYLHIQMWDKDILKYNDCVGETMLDIGKFYRKAYHKNCAVNFFETLKGTAMDRVHKKKKGMPSYLILIKIFHLTRMQLMIK